MSIKKWVYSFGNGKAEGNASMKSLLGGKGAGLAEMTNLKIPVPPGFTISTEACVYYAAHNQSYPAGLQEEIDENLENLERVMGKNFGDNQNPLLVSVRSGAKISMPGMMDTVLNLGLNEKTVLALANKTGNERLAYDSYRRFMQMFGNVVLGIKHVKFEKILEKTKETNGIESDTDLSPDMLKDLISKYKALVSQEKGVEFPADPHQQLKLAINAVFESWNTPRAITYRNIYKIPHDLGTGVNVQAMVFGNMGNNSGTGVAFSRDSATGEKLLYGEYLLNAQGEDVVAGIRTPQPITKKQAKRQALTRGVKEALPALEEEMPQIYNELKVTAEKLEKHYRDMQDIEFTIENGKLFLLQTRTGKRAFNAALKIAVDMVEEGLISKEGALLRIDPIGINQLLHPQIDPQEEGKHKVIAKGLAASPGVASGVAVFSAEKAVKWTKGEAKVIVVATETYGPFDQSVEKLLGETLMLVSPETTPDDIAGMEVAQGILTARGGMTSHAAIVARERGKPAVVGCEAIEIDEKNKLFKVGDAVVREGDYITIDGATGQVFLDKIPTVESEIIRVLRGEMKPKESMIYGYYNKLMAWADEKSRLYVRTNADSPKDAEVARDFGAKGIGLCRTEHMFFEERRLPIMRQMILASDEDERQEALEKLLPMQKEDFKEIFKVMEGRPVTIRLLDAPLHEFLPNMDDLRENIEFFKSAKPNSMVLMGKERVKVAEKLQELNKLLQKVKELKEMNPMLGHRGCRLGITYPEVTEMQVRAIFEAACEVTKEEGVKIIPEIMVPLVGLVNELKNQRDIVERVGKQVMQEYKIKLDYLVGTMIELPRAALTASKIAKISDFFSYGTNDLTQTTFGFSRDDAEFKFLKEYRERGIFGEDADPFVSIDQEGVGELVEIGVKRGREAKKDLKIGICGEHGGDPKSIEFFHNADLDYVSCSPYRVPIARLAAAHANLKQRKQKKGE